MHAEPPCPRNEDAAAFVAGEPSGDFEAHLAQCADCARAVKSARSLVSLLRSAQAVEISHDLAPEILEKVRTPMPSRHWPIAIGFAAAAAVVLALGFARTWLPAPPPAPLAPSHDESATRAIAWLCKAQEPDGSWNAERWGGDRRFEPALTALPLLALLADKETRPEQAAAISRAAGALRQRQAPNGSFGSAFFGACYNQGIATLALLRAHERRPDAELKRAIESACEVVVSTQTARGGWGYLHSAQPQAAITLWNVEALKLAAALGIPGIQPSLDRGQRWLATSIPADDHAKNVDFYNASFLISVLEQSSDVPPRERLAAIRETLLTTQVRDGSESGSWSPDDQWGRVGGRLYSTALASLALR